MLVYLFRRLSDVWLLLPLRLIRFMRHVVLPKTSWDVAYRSFSLGTAVLFWMLETVLRLAELIGLTEIYDLIGTLLKYQSRALKPEELAIAKSIFGDTIPYNRIRLDERAHLGPRQYHFCYVSFYTLNSWGQMPAPLLIHELTHIWQYQNLGICYIPRALAAQNTPDAYNYGGETALEQAVASGKGLAYFNLEQQADLIEDYFRLKNGLAARWNHQQAPQMALYEVLLKDIIPTDTPISGIT